MRPDSRETQLQRGSSTRVDGNRRVQRAEGKKSEPLVCCYHVICSVRSGGRKDAVIRGVSIRAIQVRASYSYLAAGGFVHRDNQTKTACRNGRGTGVKARYEAVLGREMASSAPSSVPFSHHKLHLGIRSRCSLPCPIQSRYGSKACHFLSICSYCVE